MGIFDAFKRKPRAPLVDSALKEELKIPPPPPPPSARGVSKELPAFPMFPEQEDKTPELPPLGPEIKQAKREPQIPLPPEHESILEFPQLEDKYPDISPYELEQKPSLRVGIAPKPVFEKKTIVKRVEEEHPVYRKEVSEVGRAIYKPESFVKKPIFVNVDDYKVLLGDISEIKNSLGGLNLSVAKIKNLKDKEDTEFKNWQLALEDMKKKFLFVDELLFESKG